MTKTNASASATRRQGVGSSAAGGASAAACPGAPGSASRRLRPLGLLRRSCLTMCASPGLRSRRPAWSPANGLGRLRGAPLAPQTVLAPRAPRQVQLGVSRSEPGADARPLRGGYSAHVSTPSRDPAASAVHWPERGCEAWGDASRPVVGSGEPTLPSTDPIVPCSGTIEVSSTAATAWIPACAGMTELGGMAKLDAVERR